MPNRLLIDTSCSQVSVLFCSEQHEDYLYTASRPEGGHDRFVFHALEQILGHNPNAWQSLDSLAVCIGPGRFNGVRVGCSVIATFMSLLKKPCYVANSFELLAADDAFLNIQGYAIFAKKGFAYYQEKGQEQKNVLVPICDLPFHTHVLEIEGTFIQSSSVLNISSMNTLIAKGQLKCIDRPIDIDPLYCALI